MAAHLQAPAPSQLAAQLRRGRARPAPTRQQGRPRPPCLSSSPGLAQESSRCHAGGASSAAVLATAGSSGDGQPWTLPGQIVGLPAPLTGARTRTWPLTPRLMARDGTPAPRRGSPGELQHGNCPQRPTPVRTQPRARPQPQPPLKQQLESARSLSTSPSNRPLHRSSLHVLD